MYSNFKKTMLGHDNLTDFILYLYLNKSLVRNSENFEGTVLPRFFTNRLKLYYKKLIENPAFFIKNSN
jgi:hypothetical protein